MLFINRPDPSSLTVIAKGSPALSPGDRDDLEAVLKASKGDRLPAEAVAEKDISNLSDGQVDVMLKTVRVIEARYATRSTQMSNLCNLYNSVATAARMWRLHTGQNDKLPTKFRNLLLHNLLKLPTIWRIYDTPSPEAVTDPTKVNVYDAVCAMREILDPALDPKV